MGCGCGKKTAGGTSAGKTTPPKLYQVIKNGTVLKSYADKNIAIQEAGKIPGATWKEVG